MFDIYPVQMGMAFQNLGLKQLTRVKLSLFVKSLGGLLFVKE